MMVLIRRHLDLIKDRLALALPDRIVTRSFIDHKRHRNAELERGIVTLLMRKRHKHESWSTTLELTLVGQLHNPAREALPEETENLELELESQLLAFCNNPGDGIPRISVSSSVTSSQLEHPYGWVVMEISVGPVDTSDAPDEELYPPSMTPMTGFSGIHADIDISPHETPEEHGLWLDGDYSTSRPELSTTVELKQ